MADDTKTNGGDNKPAATARPAVEDRAPRGARDPAKDAQRARQRTLESEADQRERDNAEKERRMSGEAIRPTPTQDENDRAKLGDDVSEKEDHGAPEEGVDGTGLLETPAPLASRRAE